MLSRYEYLYTKKKAKSLSDKLFEFENGRMWDERKKEFFSDDTYKKYISYMKMSETDRTKLENEWQEYYRKCSDSVYGKLFWEMKKLYMSKDIKGIKELAKKAVELTGIKLITKPSSIDPSELLMRMSAYFSIRYELKILMDLISEYAEVYEKKDEKMGL
jgi:hypothetical protein